jgi:NodT family efflux transporter outer membrane factor (OMF) lipoprotein
MTRGARIAVACACAAASTGCAVGPEFQRPLAPAVTQVTATALPTATAGGPSQADRAQRFVDAATTPPDWWRAFGSDELNALVAQALRQSPTLASAQAALRQAREMAEAQRGAFLPSVQADYAPMRARVPEAVSSPVSSGASVYTLHTAQVSVDYVFDLFGANRRSVESLDAQSESQQWQWRAARLTLVASVANAALQWASLQEQLETTDRLTAIAESQLALMNAQHRLGEASGAMVLAQEAMLRQAQATAAALRRTLAQQHDLLAALVGVAPAQLPAPALRLSGLRLPDAPTTLPARLIEQRPDIRAAEASLHAANAQVGVAVANMLPQISLTADYGAGAKTLAQLFGSAGLLWSIGADIAQPVFDGGALLHRKRASEAQLEQALGQYHGAVLNAFQNVADALEAVRHDADQWLATSRQERIGQTSLEIAQRQLELGDISRLVLLNAESNHLQAAIARVQSQANRFSDVCAVYQSLGGSWNDIAGDVK